MDIATYLAEISKVYESGVAGEHSYRPALVRLFSSIDETAEVINEPKRSEGGMPDFVFQRDGVAFGWAEAKDLPKDVIKLKGYSVEQRKRYENAYPNLIYTNGVDFEFIRDKEVAYSVKIADFLADLGGLQPLPENFERLESLLKDFAKQKPISIRSARKLAEMMAGKAEIIKGEMNDELALDPEFRSALGRQYNTFKDNLLPNLTPGEFADIYAETITYGMFAARLHDDTLDTFSRQEALEKLPKSNPFLRGLFQYIAGYDIPSRLRRVVDDLAEVLRASNPHALFEDFGKFTARNDPFIHFYETFLAAYNPKKRKSRGVWYTPEPVVDFIVRAVDGVLKTEFDIADGLADTGKVTVDWDTGETKDGKTVTIKKDVHRVQILDPATGTGTFLAKTVQTIADRVKARAPGKWSSYVEEDLLPRLHGFELLMASYAMCHMKLDMQLTESGYVPSKNPPRLSVWLTNALEPAEREVKDLFFQQLADEARGASEVKRQSPIMCVIGNPPYSGHSSNFGDWIEGLMADYKVSPELKRPAQAKWLSDDYVKFIRMSEELIAKNPSGGILGLITNHSYLDNATFVDMREHLLRTFDKIHVIDLHGNATKNEQSPDGSPDKNVFDIRQGVSLIIAAKLDSPSKRCEVAPVHFREIWGTRKKKYDALWEGSISDNEQIEIRPSQPPWNFKPFDEVSFTRYQNAFSVNDIFAPNGSPAPGIVTTHDEFAISDNIENARKKIMLLISSESEAEAKSHFRLCGTSQWSYDRAKKELSDDAWQERVTSILYRPFDTKTTVYDRNVAVHRRDRVMSHYVSHENLGLISGRQGHVVGTREWNLVFATEEISDFNLFYRGGGVSYPLYLYPDETAAQKDALAPTERTVNFDPKLYAAICEAAGIDPADTDMARADGPTPNPSRKREGSETSSRSGVSRSGVGNGASASFRAATGDARPSEVKVFDYIYGVLHSPDYRETFAEFLKIDFPRIPYPASPEVFNHVSEKGEQLRRLHLMEPAAIGETLYPFVGEHEDEDERDVVAAAHPKFVPTPVIATPDLSRGKQSSPGASGSPRRFAPRDDEIAIGRVYINPRQYFDKVPQVAWEFYIGGYQPAQKWLKDRKGRVLSWDDITHYQSIVKILLETDRIMREIKLPIETA